MPNARKPSKSSHSPASASESVENFLKAVYALQQHSERVSTNALAAHLGVKAPSVTDMARRMVETEMIDHQKYHGVRLTQQGEITALAVIRRHRLIELYLVRELGYPLYEVHAEAERLEHAVSERFISALDSKLGYPEIDPHGDPIPSAAGHIAPSSGIPLTELALNIEARVARLNTSNSEMLEHLVNRNITLGDTITVRSRDPFDGPLRLVVNGQAKTLGYKAAACVMVEAKEG